MNDPFEGDLDLISLGSPGDIVGHFDGYIRLVRERFHHFETAFHSIRESCKLSDKDWMDDYAIRHLCSMGDYFKRLYDESVEIRNLTLKAQPSAARELLTKFWNTKKREIVDSYGVLSLTESPDDPPMWAYYGDNNRGVCIGYLSGVQPVKAWKKYRYHKVHYIEDRALDMLEVGFESTFEKLLTTKSKSWSHEREWRLVTLKGRGSQKANPRAIAKIILGKDIHLLNESDRTDLYWGIVETNKRRRGWPIPVEHAFKSKTGFSILSRELTERELRRVLRIKTH